MKNLLKYTFLIVAAMTLAISCEDESLDPLNMKTVKKGTLLALRGTQLQNIYVKGINGAEFNPRTANGTEKFNFDAEFLSSDPNALSSFDIYVLKRPSLDRVLLTNIPASQFKKDATYPNPWVSVSLNLTDIIKKLGFAGTYPLTPTEINTFLTTYAGGIPIESDLNLVDGTKVLAADLVAAGLYQSNQFYPAQKLSYGVLNYCPEDLAGTYSYVTVVTGVGEGGNAAPCAPQVTGTGELKVVSLGKYSISDATFGQYDCAWNDNPAKGVTLTNACDKITLGGADQYALVYTMSNLQVSPDQKTISFSWENDYGDKGNTSCTRTDTKLWPSALHN